MFYLHGKIIEDKGVDGIHPDFGKYEYDKILDTLAKAGFVVISEARPKDTDSDLYANKVVSQIDSLLKAKVSPENITVVGASKSTLVDSVFAKFQVKEGYTGNIFYNESSDIHTNFNYQPALGKLDRLHLRTRLHSQQQGSTTYGTLLWPTREYSLTIEIVTLENSFDDYSSIETRLNERSDSGFFGVGV